jgi:hypothetical protein
VGVCSLGVCTRTGRPGEDKAGRIGRGVHIMARAKTVGVCALMAILMFSLGTVLAKKKRYDPSDPTYQRVGNKALSDFNAGYQHCLLRVLLVFMCCSLCERFCLPNAARRSVRFCGSTCGVRMRAFADNRARCKPPFSAFMCAD